MGSSLLEYAVHPVIMGSGKRYFKDGDAYRGDEAGQERDGGGGFSLL
jgi:hypothetical protein